MYSNQGLPSLWKDRSTSDPIVNLGNRAIRSSCIHNYVLSWARLRNNTLSLLNRSLELVRSSLARGCVYSRGVAVVAMPEAESASPDFHAITGTGLSRLRIAEGLHPWRWKGADRVETRHPHAAPLISFVRRCFLLAPIWNSLQRYCCRPVTGVLAFCTSFSRHRLLILASRETSSHPRHDYRSTDVTRVVK